MTCRFVWRSSMGRYHSARSVSPPTVSRHTACSGACPECFGEVDRRVHTVGGRGHAGVEDRGTQRDRAGTELHVHHRGALRSDGQFDAVRSGRDSPRLRVPAGRGPDSRCSDDVDDVGVDGLDVVIAGGRLRASAVGGCGIDEVRQRLVDVQTYPPGREGVAQPYTLDCSRDGRCAEQDVPGQLRPGGQGLAYLDQGGRAPGRKLSCLNDFQDIGHLLATAQGCQATQVGLAEQPVQDRSAGILVEPFDIDQTAVATGHQNWHAAGPRRFPHEELDVEGVALFDDDVEAIDETVHRFGGHTRCRDLNVDVGVDFGDALCGNDGLVHADVEKRRGNPVEVRQLQLVEIRQPQLRAHPLGGEGVGDGVADAEAHDADPKRAELLLLLDRDEVPVAVQSHPAKRPRAEDADHCPPPRVVDPAARLSQQALVRPWQQFLKVATLFGQSIDHHDLGARTQSVKKFEVTGIVRIDDRCIGRLQPGQWDVLGQRAVSSAGDWTPLS